MGKEGGREGKRGGGEEQDIPDHINSSSHLMPSGQFFCNWTSIIPARFTHLHCSLCPSAREVLALVDDILVLHCVCHK